MTHTDFLKSLGAPVASIRQSWGSLRERDGVVFLFVWQDRVERRNDCLFVRITAHLEHKSKPNDFGHVERLAHVERIRQGATCYLVMCKAVDVNAQPRSREPLDPKEDLFTSGEIIEREDGELLVRLGTRIAYAQIK